MGRLPGSVDRNWDRVRDYPVRECGLDPDLLAWCHDRHMVWADGRANAVCVTRDAKGEPAGAELHGTGPHPACDLNGRDDTPSPPVDQGPGGGCHLVRV